MDSSKPNCAVKRSKRAAAESSNCGSMGEVIPKKAVYRLSIYHRCLRKLEENGVDTVSSSALAKAAGVKPSQLRKDFGYLGQFGTRGLGYSVGALMEVIKKTIGRAKLQPVVLVGVGNLGSALLRYDGFKKEGFEVVAAFDLDPAQVAERIALDIPVLGQDKICEFVSENEIRMAILAVPGPFAQSVANDLVACGVVGILNFSPVILQVPDGVVVNSVDLALELEQLSYFVRPPETGEIEDDAK